MAHRFVDVIVDGPVGHQACWGGWNGRSDLNLAFDEVIQLAGRDIGLTGVNRRSDCWFLDKLYLLPAYQSRGTGSYLLQRLIDDAKAAQVALRLTVVEINPARRLYEMSTAG